MRRIWVDLIREERENPERGRERWCGECAIWKVAAGAMEREGGRQSMAEPDASETAEDVLNPIAERGGAETHHRTALPTGTATHHDAESPPGAAPVTDAATHPGPNTPPIPRDEHSPDSPARTPIVPGRTR